MRIGWNLLCRLYRVWLCECCFFPFLFCSCFSLSFHFGLEPVCPCASIRIPSTQANPHGNGNWAYWSIAKVQDIWAFKTAAKIEKLKSAHIEEGREKWKPRINQNTLREWTGTWPGNCENTTRCTNEQTNDAKTQNSVSNRIQQIFIASSPYTQIHTIISYVTRMRLWTFTWAKMGPFSRERERK